MLLAVNTGQRRLIMENKVIMTGRLIGILSGIPKQMFDPGMISDTEWERIKYVTEKIDRSGLIIR